MKLKNKIFMKFGIGGNLIIISIIFIIAGFIPNMVKIVGRNISQDYIETTAKIIRIEEGRRSDVTVNYILPNSGEHTALLDTYVEGMIVGDEIQIYAQLSNPDNITLKGNQFWQAVIFGAIGGVLMIISIVLLRKHKEKNKTKNVLEL